MRLSKTLLPCLLLLLFNATATAQMRCNGELIGEGDSEVRVLAACGEPMQRELVHGLPPLVDERWIYNFGPDELIRIVDFRNGLVDQIEVGDEYGFTPDFDEVVE